MISYSTDNVQRANTWMDNYKHNGTPNTEGAWESRGEIASYTGKFTRIEQVAFDPNGTGRKDHVAYVAFCYEDGDNNRKLFAWVYDAKANTHSTPQRLTNNVMPDWIWDNPANGRWVGNYVAVTAGDFNGDGKDTLVIYTPTGTVGDTNVREYRYSNGSLTELGKSPVLLNERCFDLGDVNVVESSALCVDLEAADLNGDAIDDLAVVSTLARVKNTSSPVDATAFGSQLNVSFGKLNRGTSIVSTKEASTMLWDGGTRNDGRTTYRTMFDTNISAGDVDGDGYLELVCAGWKTSVITAPTNASGTKTSDVRSGSSTASCGVMVIGGADSKLTTKTAYTTVNSNDWTKKMIDQGDSYWPAVQMECVAINGKYGPEYVFLNGTFFDESFGQGVYQDKYFDQPDAGVSWAVANSAFMVTVAAGNFDGNDAGREQVAFGIALRESGSNDYWGKCFLSSATGYDDKTDADGNVTYGLASGWQSFESQYLFENKGISWTKGWNLNLVAFDRDNDGTLASYDHTWTAYSDPTPQAVIQAAPYFRDLGSYGDFGDGGTSYSISQSYDITKGESDSCSITLGCAAEIETPAVKTSVEIGYSGGYSKGWEKSYTTTWTDTFNAGAYDTVVVSRTPITYYVYNVWTEDENGTVIAKDDSLSISAPGKPTYVQLTIPQYNEFVKKYNAQADKLNANPTSSASATSKAKAKITKLNPIDLTQGDMRFLGNEGNPWGYRSNWGTSSDSAQQVSKSMYTMNDSGGSVSSNYAVETGEASIVTGNFGFETSVTVQGGADAVVAEVWVGGYLDVAYSHEWSTTKTSTNGTETSGTVCNIDPYDLGITEETSKAYGFNWSFGQWNFRALTNQSGVNLDIPVVGYSVTNIRVPSPAVSQLDATAVDKDAIELEWNIPSDPKAPKPDGYFVYVLENGDFKKIKTVDGGNVSSTVVDGLESNTTYTFRVCSFTKEYDPAACSMHSPEASDKTFKKSFQLDFDPGKHATMTMSQMGSVAIASGSQVPEQTMVNGVVTAKEGYSVSKLYIQKGTNPEQELEMSADGQFYFVLTSNTKVRAETQKMVSQAVVTINAADGGSVQGYCEGIAFNPNGSTVSDQIELVAAPQTGKVLKSWIVTTTDTTGTTATTEYPALGSNSYSFFASKPVYEITPVFVDEGSPEVSVTFTLNKTGNGTVTVTGNNDKVYEPADDGTYTLVKGDLISIIAAPAKNWVLSDWTGALEDFDKSNKTVTFKANEDTTAGVVFVAPVKYTLTYQANVSQLGNVTCQTSTSGQSHAAGASHVIKAQATDGNRLTQWIIQKTGAEEQIIPVEGLATEGEYAIEELDANTTVIACFQAIETYDLTVNAANCTVTVTRDGQAVDPGTDALRYGDVITVDVQGNQDFLFESFKLNGQNAESGATLTVSEDVTIDASYVKIPLASVTVPKDAYLFTGQEITPEATVKDADGNVVESKYFDLKYEQNVEAGTATVTAEGKNGYDGTVTTTFTIYKIALASVTVPQKTYDFTGKAITPVVTVKDADGNRVKAESYVVAFAQNVKTGKATVTATGKGAYEGTVTTTFTIKDNVQANSSKLNAGSLIYLKGGKLYIKWGKVPTASKYEVYVTECSKNFKKTPTKTVSAKTVSLSISTVSGKKLDPTKCYKMKVKAYRMNGKTKVSIGSALQIHVAGAKSGFTNVKALKVATSAVSVSAGKTKKMPKVYTVKADITKKLLTTDHDPLLRYWSSNTKIATVTSKGTIKGIAKGTCYVRAMAQNGKTVAVKVTVK
ncbi:MAG: fibronectin type III domain-containing protein [Coriobacteriia bacterium]|nr:fibronectin type III domain-containing protein [Coriobacteriia bacterium]